MQKWRRDGGARDAELTGNVGVTLGHTPKAHASSHRGHPRRLLHEGTGREHARARARLGGSQSARGAQDGALPHPLQALGGRHQALHLRTQAGSAACQIEPPASQAPSRAAPRIAGVCWRGSVMRHCTSQGRYAVMRHLPAVRPCDGLPRGPRKQQVPVVQLLVPRAVQREALGALQPQGFRGLRAHDRARRFAWPIPGAPQVGNTSRYRRGGMLPIPYSPPRVLAQTCR